MESTKGRTSFAELKRRAVSRAADEALSQRIDEGAPYAPAAPVTASQEMLPTFDEIVAGTATWPSTSTATAQIDVSGALLPLLTGVDEAEDALLAQEPRVAPMGRHRPQRADTRFVDVDVDLVPCRERRSWLMHVATALLILVVALVVGVAVYMALAWSTPIGEVELPGWVPQPVQELLSPPDS